MNVMQETKSKLHHGAKSVDFFLPPAHRKLRVRAVAFALLAALLVPAGIFISLPAIHAQSDQTAKTYSTDKAEQEAQRKRYAEKVAQTYNFAFGKGKLSVPGNGAV